MSQEDYNRGYRDGEKYGLQKGYVQGRLSTLGSPLSVAIASVKVQKPWWQFWKSN